MRYLTNVEATKTDQLIKTYQLSDSEEIKRTILTVLYVLWKPAIFNFSWYFIGKSKHNLECIEASSGLRFEDLTQEAFLDLDGLWRLMIQLKQEIQLN